MTQETMAKLDAIPAGTRVSVEVRIGRCPLPLATLKGVLLQRVLPDRDEWTVADTTAAGAVYLHPDHHAELEPGNRIVVNV